MGIYEKHVLPRLIHYGCGQKPMTKQRRKVVPLAEGRVLEIGIGSGLNLPVYDSEKVERIWGIDPSAELLAMAEETADAAEFDVELINAPAESIPLDSDSADTVLVTYALCTIPELFSAMDEIRRVLKRDGTLIFCEHGEAPDASVRRWQDFVNPLWVRITGGCNLNRPIPSLLEQGGFSIQTLETMYLPGWKPGTFNYWGTATQA